MYIQINVEFLLGTATNDYYRLLNVFFISQWITEFVKCQKIVKNAEYKDLVGRVTDSNGSLELGLCCCAWSEYKECYAN